MDFFRVSRYEIVNQPFIYPSLASAKNLFRFSMTKLKFSVNVSSFFGFLSVEIKADDGYQIGRRISSSTYNPPNNFCELSLDKTDHVIQDRTMDIRGYPPSDLISVV